MNSRSIRKINILSESLCILTIARGFIGLVQGEGDITGDSELVERDIDKGLMKIKISVPHIPYNPNKEPHLVYTYLLSFS